MLSTIMDIIVIAALAIAFLRGIRKGFLGHIIGIVALLIGIFGGNYFAEKYAPKLAESFFMPWVSQKVEQAVSLTPFSPEKIIEYGDRAADEAESLLTEFLDNIDLPWFSLQNIHVSTITDFITSTADSAAQTGQKIQNATAAIIATKIAHMVIFIIAFIIVQSIAFYVLSIINKIFKLPIIGSVNRLAGGLLGLLSTTLVLTTIFGIISAVLPPATAPGGALSDEVLSSTYVAKYIKNASDSLIVSLLTQ